MEHVGLLSSKLRLFAELFVEFQFFYSSNRKLNSRCEKLFLPVLTPVQGSQTIPGKIWRQRPEDWPTIQAKTGKDGYDLLYPIYH
jgi:hypothetical protein